MAKDGRFIVIEGSDGSGKATHTKLLVSWLKASGANVHLLDFPQYGRPSAYFVEQYLNGHFGELKNISAKRASVFYAVDRYAASFGARDALSRGDIVVSNRYVGSNMAHQGGKIANTADRHEYFKWNDNLEYEILGIPRPDLNIVLQMPPEVASSLIDKKQARAYIQKGTRDIHEQDPKHLRRAYETFSELCRLFPDYYVEIDCAGDNQARSIEAIQAQIRGLVEAVI